MGLRASSLTTPPTLLFKGSNTVLLQHNAEENDIGINLQINK
jgi:hypothetical protein